jgi:hypothetical protein
LEKKSEIYGLTAPSGCIDSPELEHRSIDTASTTGEVKDTYSSPKEIEI